MPESPGPSHREDVLRRTQREATHPHYNPCYFSPTLPLAKNQSPGLWFTISCVCYVITVFHAWAPMQAHSLLMIGYVCVLEHGIQRHDWETCYVFALEHNNQLTLQRYSTTVDRLTLSVLYLNRLSLDFDIGLFIILCVSPFLSHPAGCRRSCATGSSRGGWWRVSLRRTSGAAWTRISAILVRIGVSLMFSYHFFWATFDWDIKVDFITGFILVIGQIEAKNQGISVT